MVRFRDVYPPAHSYLTRRDLPRTWADCSSFHLLFDTLKIGLASAVLLRGSLRGSRPVCCNAGFITTTSAWLDNRGGCSHRSSEQRSLFRAAPDRSEYGERRSVIPYLIIVVVILVIFIFIVVFVIVIVIDVIKIILILD